MSEPLVVIGNGMAAARFADELSKRALGRYAVAVVGEEPRLAYNRVLLSSVLAGEVASSDIELKPHGWWRDRGITLRYGCRATAIDHAGAHASRSPTASPCPSPSSCSRPARSRSGPQIPGMALPGVITFRDINDIWTIWHRAGAGDRVVVIGGGLLGLEAAYGLAKAGARVTVLHLMDRLMERQLDRARGRDAAARRRGERASRSCSKADTAEISGEQPRRGRDAEGRPHDRGRCGRGGDRHPAERRSRARRRHRGEARHRGRRRARDQQRAASTRSANAPSIAASATAWSSPRTSRRACWPTGWPGATRTMPAACSPPT